MFLLYLLQNFIFITKKLHLSKQCVIAEELWKIMSSNINKLTVTVTVFGLSRPIMKSILIVQKSSEFNSKTLLQIKTIIFYLDGRGEAIFMKKWDFEKWIFWKILHFISSFFWTIRISTQRLRTHLLLNIRRQAKTCCWNLRWKNTS